MSNEPIIIEGRRPRKYCIAPTNKGPKCKRWALLGEDHCKQHHDKLLGIIGINECTYIKSNGEKCRKDAMEIGPHCYKHGGKKAVGMAHPSYIDGQHSRYSKYLSKSMAQDYEFARLDPNPLNFADDIAWLQSVVLDAQKRAQAGESAKTWKDAQKLFKKMQDCARREDEAGYRGFEIELEKLFASNTARHAALQEAVDFLMKKVSIVDKQVTHQIKVGQLILLPTVHDKMVILLEGIKAALDKHTDSKTGRRVLMDSQDVLRQIFEAKT